jgi:hypothetical protein
MTDIAAGYLLTTPGGNISFNDGAEDQYYITSIRGLESGVIRAPIDSMPQTDGAIIHDFFFGQQSIVVDGFFFITSSRVMNTILAQRNTMTSALRTALNSILRADGTLAWTPLGQSAESLTVRYEVPLQPDHIDNYLNRSFSFGLVSGDPLL